MYVLEKDGKRLTVYHEVDKKHLEDHGFVLVQETKEEIPNTPRRGRPPKAKE